jgi:hypothetical protein
MFASFAIVGDSTCGMFMTYHFANTAMPSRLHRDALPCARIERRVPRKGFFLKD